MHRKTKKYFWTTLLALFMTVGTLGLGNITAAAAEDSLREEELNAEKLQEETPDAEGLQEEVCGEDIELTVNQMTLIPSDGSSSYYYFTTEASGSNHYMIWLGDPVNDCTHFYSVKLYNSKDELVTPVEEQRLNSGYYCSYDLLPQERYHIAAIGSRTSLFQIELFVTNQMAGTDEDTAPTIQLTSEKCPLYTGAYSRKIPEYYSVLVELPRSTLDAGKPYCGYVKFVPEQSGVYQVSASYQSWFSNYMTTYIWNGARAGMKTEDDFQFMSVMPVNREKGFSTCVMVAGTEYYFRTFSDRCVEEFTFAYVRDPEGNERGSFGKNGNLSWVWDKNTKTVTFSGKDSLKKQYSSDYILPTEQLGFPSRSVIEHVRFRDCTIADAMLTFSNWSNLVDVDFSGLTLGSELSFSGVFTNCANLTTISLKGMEVSHITDVEKMAARCPKLDYINLAGCHFTGLYPDNAKDQYIKLSDNYPAAIYAPAEMSRCYGIDVEKTSNGAVTYYHNLRLQNSSFISGDGLNQVWILEGKDNDLPDADWLDQDGFGWKINSKLYFWYENGQIQGTYADARGVMGDGTIRGREIYDPVSNGWYWLDAVYEGAKARNKEVWMPYIYQEEAGWDAATIERNAAASGTMKQQVINAINSRCGKWVRYDAYGKMIKGWYTVSGSDVQLYPEQSGNVYYYDDITGLMAKGWTEIDGVMHYFDETSGKMLQ